MWLNTFAYNCISWMRTSTQKSGKNPLIPQLPEGFFLGIYNISFFLFPATFMFARMNMSLQRYSSPAVLLSRLTTITSESCVTVSFLYFRFIFWMQISLVQNDGVTKTLFAQKFTSHSNVTGIAMESKHVVQPGTYHLNISAAGQGDLYIKSIEVGDVGDCQNGKLQCE